MKHFRNIFLVGLLLFSMSRLSAVQVTFNVDMSNQTVAPTGVFIAGSFQGWNTTSTPLNPPVFGAVYSITVDILAGTAIQFKFLNGSTWENFSGPCTIPPNNNRSYTVPQSNVVLPAVCFNSCNICNPPLVNITFQVDMSQQTVAPDGVFLAGTFNGWSNNNPMTSAGNGIYALTLSLGAGDYHQYKFKNGATGWETVPVACAQSSNRFINVPSVSTTLEAVCFGSCFACGPPPVPVSITFQVDMSNETVSPQGVHIAGGFQGWNPGSTPMIAAGNGIYTYTATLNSGSYQEYKFVNGATWDEAEWVPEECASGSNRYFTVPQTAFVIDLVCYSSCEPCAGPVLPLVTFQVDMSEQTVSPDGVHLAIQNGNPLLNPMEHLGNNIYSITLPFAENQVVNYKFSNGISLPGNYEQIPPECRIGTPFTGGYWRTTTIPGFDITLPQVCYSKCDPCTPVNVTFRVDMSNETVSPDGVHIAGSFQGWNAASTPMTGVGNGIYELTLVFPANQYIEYKFINGISFSLAESVPEACGVDDTYEGFNRFLTVPQEDVILATVCFGSCEDCIIPVEVEVTFQVDMTNEVVSPEGVHIAGSFQGWSTSGTPMTHIGNNIYSYTTMLLEGAYHEYKFINGNTWPEAEIVPEACSANGNRSLIVPAGGTVLDVVCFSGCMACPLLVQVSFSVDMSQQEVSPNGVHLVGDFQNWDPEATPMTHMGDGIYTVEITLTAESYQTYRYINGNSFDTGVENVPEECGVDDGFGGMKRFFTVPSESVNLDVVCFNLCGLCPQLHNITIPAGWSGLSSYIMPGNSDIEALLGDILSELVIIQTMSWFYYPATGTNTIGTWQSQSAYQIKIANDVVLTISGYVEENKTMQLNEGWNLIPVISSQQVAAADLFASVANHLIIVKDAAGLNIFWPAYSINTIGSLQPGKAYFVKMAAPGTITFP